MKLLQPSTLAAAMLLATLLSWSGLVQADVKIRTTSYEYDAQGFLSKVVIESNIVQSCLQSSYTYDPFGNRTSVSSTYCAGAVTPATNSALTPRTSGDNYGTDCRFIFSSNNALSQSETMILPLKNGLHS